MPIKSSFDAPHNCLILSPKPDWPTFVAFRKQIWSTVCLVWIDPSHGREVPKEKATGPSNESVNDGCSRAHVHSAGRFHPAHTASSFSIRIPSIFHFGIILVCMLLLPGFPTCYIKSYSAQSQFQVPFHFCILQAVFHSTYSRDFQHIYVSYAFQVIPIPMYHILYLILDAPTVINPKRFPLIQSPVGVYLLRVTEGNSTH